MPADILIGVVRMAELILLWLISVANFCARHLHTFVSVPALISFAQHLAATMHNQLWAATGQCPQGLAYTFKSGHQVLRTALDQDLLVMQDVKARLRIRVTPHYRRLLLSGRVTYVKEPRAWILRVASKNHFVAELVDSKP